ncbi:DUF859 domain-containing protein [Streptococcus parauberis]|uniref:Phage capsid protein n=1 Tax=Streptococcus parauberis KRS-02083 TaxID=1207545 RepID=A0ABP2T161_9STRE|nr:DUF859 family phage minor structural protein [Streptococcus parauberis]EMG26238.1 Phage capsid protein [Streptococcus parauberis KRS-02083]QBX18086.1 capsid and scaffold protein [Streptococcus phage Javan393]WEM65825.1 DUF859 family phage minor structural protein [Streptococcus parauberis]WOF47702.1 DUF859 domain-containing protein [Streptococcus parauberis]
MAQSNFSGSWGSNLTLDASYVVKSQDIAKNQSIITLTVKLKANGYAYITGASTKPLTLNVNGGGAIPQVDVNISAGQTKTIWQADYPITHNADGTKSFTISSKLDINVSNYGSATVAFPAYMPKINRTSTVNVPDATLGSAVNIAISKADTNYTSTLRYDWYGSTGTIVDKTTSTTYSWTPPISLASGIPNSVSGSGKIYIDTYSGTSLLGTSSTTLTANVPSSVVPTLSSVTLSDTNPKVSAILSSPNFLQVLSNIAVNFSGASGAYGSTIQSYKAEIVGKNQSTTTNGGTLGIMNYNGTYTIRATVTDSRGRTSTAKDTTITVLEYFLPVFYYEVSRIGADSQTIQVKRNAKIAPIMVGGTQKNTMTISFRTSLAGKNTWTTSQTGGGSWSAINTLTDSPDSLSGVFSVSNSYDIEGTISDKFSGDIKFSATVGTKVVVSSKDKDGRHGFGRIADKSLPNGSVDISGVFAINGKQLLDIFYPVGTIYESIKSDNPSAFMGGTWARFGNGRVLVGVDESDTDFNTVNKTGGEKTHVLTEAEMPSHTHPGENGTQFHMYKGTSGETATDGVNSGTSFKSKSNTGATGGNQAHNNLQPYVTVYRWQRTA